MPLTGYPPPRIEVARRPAYDAYAALGLDFLTGYVWSWSSVLGQAEPAVVAATFGVFEPAEVAGLLGAARETCSLEQIRAAREQGATAALREVLPDLPELAATTALLQAAAATADVIGRPLIAGALSQQQPTEVHAAVWHVATVLRECRGDSHLAACVAAGLTGLEANLLTELWVGYPPRGVRRDARLVPGGDGQRAGGPAPPGAARRRPAERGRPEAA